MTTLIAAYLEIGSKRTFAGAVEWPGWCRTGRGEEEALAALLAYMPRYARVAEACGFPFNVGTDLDVAERLTGGAGTDFGVPSVAPSADERPLDASELDRQSRLLVASWQAFDITLGEAAEAGVELRKGPRGGGRDLPKIEMHVLEAEEAYLSRLGSRVPRPAGASVPARMSAMREAILATLAARARDEPIPEPSGVERRWSPRYFVRRAAWHVLDHAWEIEDRSTVG
jgi:hypothetical protein